MAHTPDRPTADDTTIADQPQSARTSGAAVNESGEVVGAWASAGELAQRPTAQQRAELQDLTAEGEQATTGSDTTDDGSASA